MKTGDLIVREAGLNTTGPYVVAVKNPFKDTQATVKPLQPVRVQQPQRMSDKQPEWVTPVPHVSSAGVKKFAVRI